MNREDEIQEIVERETRAWDTQDVNLLMTIFHHDMVWAWPPSEHAHDPIEWVMELGRFNMERWSKSFQKLFDTHELIHNKRTLRKIIVSKEGDGAFAVVDVNTLWQDKETGKDFHWIGRACKMYTLVNGEWKMISHTGLLEYADLYR